MASSPRIFLVAGEASGDLHAASLITALRSLEPSLQCQGLGGERMRAAGCALRYPLADHAVMGYRDVLLNLRFFSRLLADTAAHLAQDRPDLLILVDYPGFNLRLAARAKAAAKANGLRVLYYISPQVWAWKPQRVREIKQVVDRMMVIFPFEREIYERAGVPVDYVGHPLVDQLSAETPDAALRTRLAGRETIALLPGSRKREIQRNLPAMLAAADGRDHAGHPHPGLAVAVPPGVAPVARAILDAHAARDVELLPGKAHDLMAASRFAFVVSGTATLETAWYGTPMCVVYQMPMLSYALARMVVRTPHIALANIVAGRGVVPEVVGWRDPVERMRAAARALLPDGPAREQCRAGLAEVRAKLGEPGASLRAARVALGMLRP